jgi:hypothetical protein
MARRGRTCLSAVVAPAERDVQVRVDRDDLIQLCLAEDLRSAAARGSTPTEKPPYAQPMTGTRRPTARDSATAGCTHPRHPPSRGPDW